MGRDCTPATPRTQRQIAGNAIVYPDEAALTPLEFGAAVTLTDPNRAELMARFKSA